MEQITPHTQRTSDMTALVCPLPGQIVFYFPPTGYRLPHHMTSAPSMVVHVNSQEVYLVTFLAHDDLPCGTTNFVLHKSQVNPQNHDGYWDWPLPETCPPAHNFNQPDLRSLIEKATRP